MVPMTAGTLVVCPSLSLSRDELGKITGVLHYEARMLFLALLAADPNLRVVVLTSVAVPDGVLDYYLRFGPDATAADRVRLLSLDDPGPAPLTAKLLERPDVLDRVRSEVHGDGLLFPFNVSPLEDRLAAQLGLRLWGPPATLAHLGSKTGSRRVAQRAGVAVLPGAEGLASLDEAAEAIAGIEADTVVCKLNDSFSGMGNVIVERRHVRPGLVGSECAFCADGESWSSYERKVAEQGCIVEALVTEPGTRSPSCQLAIGFDGEPVVLSTHDQILGGPRGQVYLGCRFPADDDYRLQIQQAGLAVGRVLADEGVRGLFGIDFVVTPSGDVSLSEINLRAGGTTHPFGMARLVTGGRFDDASGRLVGPDGEEICYRASDNLKGRALVGRSAADVIADVDRAGLAFDGRRGVTLHLFGPLRDHGKMGAVCIAPSPDDADRDHARLCELLGAHDA